MGSGKREQAKARWGRHWLPHGTGLACLALLTLAPCGSGGVPLREQAEDIGERSLVAGARALKTHGEHVARFKRDDDALAVVREGRGGAAVDGFAEFSHAPILPNAIPAKADKHRVCGLSASDEKEILTRFCTRGDVPRKPPFPRGPLSTHSASRKGGKARREARADAIAGEDG